MIPFGIAHSIVNIYHSGVVQAGQLCRSQRSTRLADAGHGRPVGSLMKSCQKKFACSQVRIARICALSCIPEQRSPNRFGLGIAFHAMSCDVVRSIRNEDIRCLRGSIVRKRITRTVHVTQCTCERCGHIWEVPDGRKIQRNCPAKPCRTHLWDKPITRQWASDSAKATRPKDWAARRARGWKPPASKS